MTLAQQAAEALAGLGDTPDEIAAMLLGAGYRGRQFDAYHCPCGECLRDHFGIAFGVNTTQSAIVQPGPADTPKVLCSVAPHVNEFANAFDAGKYPELVQP